jgi:hypothetical protein
MPSKSTNALLSQELETLSPSRLRDRLLDAVEKGFFLEKQTAGAVNALAREIVESLDQDDDAHAD